VVDQARFSDRHVLIDVYRVGTIEKLRWKPTRRERMLEQRSKQST
jgi:hypothetical protein